MALAHQTEHDPRHGEAVSVAPGVVRVTARNGGPFTFRGTNSYIVGRDTLAVIDPGPDDDEHLAALQAAIAGRPVSHILVTHTHADHSPLAARLRDETGATTCAEGPHRAARPMHEGETNMLDASADRAFVPDVSLAHGDAIEGDGWRFETVLTPGHTANHAAFALTASEAANTLFAGDHVMAWATTIVAPPDGSMGDYIASLDVLLDRLDGGHDTLYLPGHGGELRSPRPYVKGLKTHRLMRERAVLERVRAGDETIPAMVETVYRTTPKKLHGAAALSVFAHLEDLAARGLVTVDGPVALDARYRAVV